MCFCYLFAFLLLSMKLLWMCVSVGGVTCTRANHGSAQWKYRPISCCSLHCCDTCVELHIRLHPAEGHTISRNMVPLEKTYICDMCVCVNKYEYKIALGAVAPAVLGCWLVSWQSSGSHGNEEQDAPSLDLWCSLPPGELHEDRGQNQWFNTHLKWMNMRNLRGQKLK